MLSLGYTNKDIDKIVNTNEIVRYSELGLYNKVREIFNYLLSIGYNEKQIIKMTIIHPELISLGIQNIDNKIKKFISLGYSYEDVIKMTVQFPMLYGLSINNIDKKIEDMISLGYSLQNVRDMTKKLPTLYGMKLETIKEKKEFYDRIGIGEYIVKDPRKLMQSIDLSYARYMFYRGMGIKITRVNCYLLFDAQDDFIRKFGKNNKQLLDLYSYDEYLKKRKERVRKRVAE